MRSTVLLLAAVMSFLPLGALPWGSGGTTLAQEVSTEAPSSEAEPSTKPRHPVPRIDETITIDGELDEPAWDRALLLTLDYETNPADNQPADEALRTELLMMYDQGQLYVAFRAHDPSPETIRARYNDRDRAFQDDFIGFAVDTFNNGRQAFEFFLNPLGVQMDLIYDDVNFNEDSSWDGLWSSGGRLTDFGFQVEMAVPFSSLRFPATSGPQVWSIDALRIRPRSFRQRLGLNRLPRDANCYLCNFTELEGFEGISPGRDLEIVPTFTAGRVDTREDFPDGPLESGDEETDFGLTVNWGITPNLNLAATLNPDFSQVEADVAQLDVNNRFTLFFPERRPFFLEDQELFNSPINAVFTRNVSDPSWGLKLTGKQGKNAMGVFVAEDDVTNLVFPGSEGSSADSFDFETTDAVVRYRRDQSDKLSLGFLATSREGGDYSSQLVGFDGLYRFTSKDYVNIQWLTSSTEYPDEIVEDYDQPAGTLDDTALRLRYEHSGRQWVLWSIYEDYGEDFRADLGFEPQVGIRGLVSGFQRTFYGDDDEWYSRLRYAFNFERVEEKRSGDTLEEEIELRFIVEGPRQMFLRLEAEVADATFEGVEFEDLRELELRFSIRPTRTIFFGFAGSVGDQVDFANVRPGEILRLSPEFRFDIGRHLRLNLDHDLRRLDVDGGELFEANLSQLRLVYQFNRRTFFRAIFQRTHIERDLALYDDPGDLDAESERLFTQLLFSYKLNARTVLFLGATDNLRGTDLIDLTEEDRALFFKVGYAWVL